jgi:hypothetical protein
LLSLALPDILTALAVALLARAATLVLGILGRV